MHFGLFTWGTRGDIQPFVALSLGLIEQGHQVTMFAPENFRSFIEGYGVTYSALSGNADEILYTPEARRVLRTGNTIALVRLMQKGGRKLQPLVNLDLYQGCQKVDVIISSVLCQVWIACIAEKLNKKWGVITFSPPTTPTREFPFSGFSFPDRPRFNWFSHKLFEYVYWTFNKNAINQFRLSISLPVLKTNILDRITNENILNLYAISPSLIPRPGDWPSNSDITGFLSLSGRNNDPKQETSVELLDFMEKGDPPVYIGLGSMPIPDPDLFRNIISEILKTTSHRIIFCEGWSKVPDMPRHNNLFVLSYIDHEWLLPQCKLAIIHGGAGTIATVLKAKIPMIITSVVGDQPWWGKMIESRSLGLHIPFKKLSTQRLLWLIDRVQTMHIRENVISIGDKISGEDGLKNSLEHINRYFYISHFG